MTELVIHDPRDPRVETIWRSLELDAAPTYFQSWGWIENWLAALHDDAPPLAVIFDRDRPVAAFFLGRHHERRHGVLPSEVFSVNACGDAHQDCCVDRNALLRAPDAGVTLETLIDHLPEDWDELELPAIELAQYPELGRLGGDRRYRARVDRELSVPIVDLDTVRSVEGGYLAIVSLAIRAQILRARHAAGQVDIEIAGDHDHALDIYGELLRLHARRHHESGRSGAFADPWFERLHRRLIAERFASGEIQLVRMSAGGTTLGCLYNLVYRGRVVAYQSGFARGEPLPGYLCHAASIAHNAAEGAACYELAGDARHEHGLATGAIRLGWVRFQRRLARFAIEDRLRGWGHDLAARIGRAGVGVPYRA